MGILVLTGSHVIYVYYAKFQYQLLILLYLLHLESLKIQRSHQYKYKII